MASLRELQEKLIHFKNEYYFLFSNKFEVTLNIDNTLQIYECDLQKVLDEIEKCINDKVIPTLKIISNVKFRFYLLDAIEAKINEFNNPLNDESLYERDTPVIYSAISPNLIETNNEKTFSYLENGGLTILERYIKGEFSVDGIIYPDNEQALLQSYINNDNYYPLLRMIENKTILQINPMSSNMREIYKLYRELSTLLSSESKSDLEVIKKAIICIEFIIRNQDTLVKESPVTITDAIFIAFLMVNTLSEDIKNRCLGFISDTGWWIFELAANLFLSFHSKTATYVPFQSDYGNFRNLMLPHIFKEDLPKLLKLLKIMYSTEHYYRNSKHDVLWLNPDLKENDKIKVIEKVVALQKNIEEKIKKEELFKDEESALSELIKVNKLKFELTHVHFFCVTINNYYSLKKIIHLIDQMHPLQSFKNESEKFAFLYGIAQIGEYLSHRKLSNKFRSEYPNIPWDIIQIIRDCFLHQDENEYYILIDKILDNKMPNVSLTFLWQELQNFKTTINKIIEKQFQIPSENFLMAYTDQYEIESEKKLPITSEEIDFFMSNLSKDCGEQEKRIWNDILNLKQKIPSNTIEVGKLKKFWPKDKELKKKFITIFDKISEYYEAENLILTKNEMKLFKETDLYKNESKKWHYILAKMYEPKIDDYEQLRALNGSAYDSLAEKIGEYIFISFVKKWSKKLKINKLLRLLAILDDMPDIQLKWKKIINEELPYPNDKDFSSDLKMVLEVLGQEDAFYFVKYTKCFKPLVLELPSFNNVNLAFLNQKKTDLSKRDMINFMILQLIKITDTFETYIDVSSILLSSISPIPEFSPKFFQNTPNKDIKSVSSDDIPEIRDKILSNEKLKDEVTENLYNKINFLLVNNVTFRNSILYNLTIAFTMLKKIIKFSEIEKSDIIYTHYSLLKKYRNDLAHENYLSQRMLGENYQIEIIIKLCALLPDILSNLRRLHNKIPLVSADRIIDPKNENIELLKFVSIIFSMNKTNLNKTPGM